MAKCSYCGKENLDDLSHCAGCGTCLHASAAGAGDVVAYSPITRKRLNRGMAWLVGGLLLTAISFSSAGHRGTHVVAWGAIAFGIAQLVQGFLGDRRPPPVASAGYNELELATRLEAQGRLQEAAAAYKSIAGRFGSTLAASDARKSLENLQDRLKRS